MFNQTIIDILNNGGLIVARTDTLYGLLARADDERAVARIYQLKKRAPNKSPIVLISNPSQLYDYYDSDSFEVMQHYWPGPNSIIVPSSKGPDWITRGNQSIAYRLPDHAELRTLIDQTGPLVAPSANPEDLPPANNIAEAKAYFGDQVDAYVDGGDDSNAQPSALYRLINGQLDRLR